MGRRVTQRCISTIQFSTCAWLIRSHSWRVDDDTTNAVPVTAHEEEVEALRLLVELLQSSDGKSVPVQIACDDGTIREIIVGENETERQEVLAMLRRQLSRILH